MGLPEENPFRCLSLLNGLEALLAQDDQNSAGQDDPARQSDLENLASIVNEFVQIVGNYYRAQNEKLINFSRVDTPQVREEIMKEIDAQAKKIEPLLQEMGVILEGRVEAFSTSPAIALPYRQ